MQNLIFYALIFVITIGKSCGLMANKKMVACKPIVSLWHTPRQEKIPHSLPFLSVDLPFHDTQILYGERLELLEKAKNGWLRVRALDQPVFDVNFALWRPLEGWVREDDVLFTHDFCSYNLVVNRQWATLVDSPSKRGHKVLSVSFGTMLSGTKRKDSWWQITLPKGSIGFITCQEVSEFYRLLPDIDVVRKRLVAMAKTFLGSPYCAGGRSAWDSTGKHTISSVDCSGLINLVYKACGFCVPRYAHYQWLRATPISSQSLALGDLVFVKYSKDNFNMVRHVMMYIGDGLLIESTGLPSICTQTRIISFQEKFGISLQNARNGQRTGKYDTGCLVGEREIYCGSFLSDPDIIKKLRQDLFDYQPITRSLGYYFMGDEVKRDENEWVQ